MIMRTATTNGVELEMAEPVALIHLSLSFHDSAPKPTVLAKNAWKLGRILCLSLSAI
jgi:hypothetical protein